MLSRRYGGKIPYAGDRIASIKGAPLHAKCRIDLMSIACGYLSVSLELGAKLRCPPL